MPTCCVSGCGVSYKNNPEKHSFHRFPVDDNEKEKWMRLISRPNWSPTKYTTVCSRHFENIFFKKRQNRVVLIEGALPTLFVPVKIKPMRAPTSYINRDITFPPLDVLPQTTNKIISPKYTKLLQKLREKQKRIRKLTAQTKRQAAKIVYLQNVLKGIQSRSQLKRHFNEINMSCNN